MVYLYFFSPNTDVIYSNRSAWFVTSSGAVDSGTIYYSYGRRSPNTDDINHTSAWPVTSSGDLDVYYHYVDVWDSCGRIHLDRLFHFFQKYWWLRSPYTRFDNRAWYVRSGGDVGDNIVSVVGSYGRTISPGMGNYIGVFFIYSDGMMSPGNGNGCILSYG